MIELVGLAAGSFALALSGALVPGPMFSATLAGSHRRGFWYGPGVIVGHALVELPVVLLLVWGLGAFLANDRVLIGVGGVGAVMLVWMGIGLVRQTRQTPKEPVGHPGQEGAAGPDAAGQGRPSPASGGALVRETVPVGVLMSVLNPYWYLWWVTVPGTLLASGVALGWPGVAAFFVGHIAADFAWYSATSLGVSRGRRLIQGRIYKGLLLGCAGILFVMAALFAKLAVEKALGAA